MSSPRAQSGSPFVAGTLVAGKYRLIKLLGEGAMGVVWSAVNEATSGPVALKLIWKPEPEYRVRLLREAKACGAVRHKNVIQIHDVGQTDAGDPFLVMELLTGETLADLLARKRRLPPPEAAAIGRDIARGLAAAHAKGIVHRDLKPANIFLHNEPGEDLPVVKVLDFGVARNPLANDGLRTADGGAVGSPMYMSPEQACRERDIDERADIWSLGVVLFEMLTGDRPFKGNLAEVLHHIQHGEIPTVARRVRRIDPALDALVTGCLTRRRDDRLGPALEVARRLDEHASPGGREQLPSLLEEGISDRISGPGSATSGAAVSPGAGPTSLQASPVPPFSQREARPSAPGRPSSGFGSTAAPLQPGPYAVTEQIAVSPVPRMSPSAPVLAGAAAPVDDDAATHRIDPRMLAPSAPGSPGPRQGPSGTVRIDQSVVDQQLAARGVDRSQLAAGLPSGAHPTLPLVPAPAGSAAVSASPAPAALTAATPAGTVSSTAPVLQAEPIPAAAPASARPKSGKLPLLVGGVALGLAGLLAVLFVFILPGKGSSDSQPEGAPTASADPAPPPQTAAPVADAPTASVTATPEPPATVAEPAPAAPSAKPTGSAKVAPTTPTVAPKPTATTRPPPPKPAAKPCTALDRLTRPECKKPKTHEPKGI